MALSNVRQKVLEESKRKNGEELRFSIHHAVGDEGRPITWYSLAVGKLKEDGEFKNSQYVAIKDGELQFVAKALHKACFGDPPSGAQLPFELPAEEESLF